MLTDEIRSTIVGALYDVDATKHVKPSRLASFEDGGEDIGLRELLLSSLARMELLVAIEMEHGAVIAPREFRQLKSLGDLATRVAQVLDGTAEPLADESEDEARDAGAIEADEPEGPKPTIVRLVQRAYRSCRVVAQVNKMLKILEHRLTPPDFAVMCAWHRAGRLLPTESPAPFRSAVAEWLDDLERRVASSGKPEPEPFAHHRIAPSAVLFAGPGERAAKTLVVCFATIGARQMSTPNPVLLQHTDATKFDVLFLSDPWGTGFRRGVPLMGSSVQQVIDWLARLPLLAEYAAIRTAGTSAGAYPAMLAARRLDAELGLSVCGRFPRPRWGTRGQILEMHLFTWLEGLRHPGTRIVMAHGKKRRDKTYTRRLGWLPGVTRLGVKMPGRKVNHNVLRPMVEEGRLGYFLAQTLFAPVDRGLLASDAKRARLSVPVGASSEAPRLDFVR